MTAGLGERCADHEGSGVCRPSGGRFSLSANDDITGARRAKRTYPAASPRAACLPGCTGDSHGLIECVPVESGVCMSVMSECVCS